MGSDQFRWRWETYSLGPKVSADVLSKQLILPLISVTHVAFSSADPVSELSSTDLEKLVDKTGRTVRRTLDTHIKHAISRPQVATTLRRMTAIVNFMPDLPPVLVDVERPELVLPMLPPRSRSVSKPPPSRIEIRDSSPDRPSVNDNHTILSVTRQQEPPGRTSNSGHPADSDTETEQSDDEGIAPPKVAIGKARDPWSPNVNSRAPSGPGSPKRVDHSVSGPSTPSAAAASRHHSPVPPSAEQASSPPSPPAKRAKRQIATSSSDEDSEAERRRRVAQLKGGTARGGAKQPIKRGGRRF